jgi:hypothetical protein
MSYDGCPCVIQSQDGCRALVGVRLSRRFRHGEICLPPVDCTSRFGINTGDSRCLREGRRWTWLDDDQAILMVVTFGVAHENSSNLVVRWEN